VYCRVASCCIVVYRPATLNKVSPPPACCTRLSLLDARDVPCCDTTAPWCDAIRGLILNNNQLSGSVPDSLGNLTQLRYSHCVCAVCIREDPYVWVLCVCTCNAAVLVFEVHSWDVAAAWRVVRVLDRCRYEHTQLAFHCEVPSSADVAQGDEVEQQQAIREHPVNARQHVNTIVSIIAAVRLLSPVVAVVTAVGAAVEAEVAVTVALVSQCHVPLFFISQLVSVPLRREGRVRVTALVVSSYAARRALELSFNQLNGTIPLTLGSVTKLTCVSPVFIVVSLLCLPSSLPPSLSLLRSLSPPSLSLSLSLSLSACP
jgi:hypothetical protein